MSDEKSLMRMAGKSIEVKSLRDLVRVRTSENPILLLDLSGSMAMSLRNGKSRQQGLREVVTGLQAKRSTPMIGFGMDSRVTEFERVGQLVGFITEVPDTLGPSTPLAEAIDMARENGYAKAVVISDGVPDDKHRAMDAARRFGGRIDVIFVGNPGEPGSLFLDELASATGGRRFEGDLADVKEITGAVVGLLNGETMEEDDDDDEDDEEDDEEDDDE